MVNPTTVSSHRNVLGLFAKAWDPGKVKTRLAKTLGCEIAAGIYFELLVLHLQRFSVSADDRAVVYSPADELTEIRFANLISSLKPKPIWDLIPQVESDLGARMSAFFEHQFHQAVDPMRVVVIGSDAPGLTPEIVGEAFEKLSDHDVVFGPSNDGGYYLVGLSVMTKDIFTDIPWSTDDVLPLSLKRCQDAGLSVAQLPQLTDIDDEEDLMQEFTELENSNEAIVNQFLEKSLPLLQKGDL